MENLERSWKVIEFWNIQRVRTLDGILVHRKVAPSIKFAQLGGDRHRKSEVSSLWTHHCDLGLNLGKNMDASALTRKPQRLLCKAEFPIIPMSLVIVAKNSLILSM